LSRVLLKCKLKAIRRNIRVRFSDKISDKIKHQCLNNTGEVLEINNNIKVETPLL